MLSVDVISSDSLDYFKIFLYEKKMPSHTHRELSQFFISVCHMLASQWLLYDHPSCSAPLLQGVGLHGTMLAGHCPAGDPKFSFNVLLIIKLVFKDQC